jgi:hypothetical protein
MSQIPASGQIYLCPMHRDVRQVGPGECPKCGMALLPEGTRFALLHHMTSRPMHLAVMLAAMLAFMAAVMMLFTRSSGGQ